MAMNREAGSNLGGDNPAPPRSRSLTQKQLQLVVLIGRGLTRKEIADRVGIDSSCITRRLQGARRRAGARTTAQLVAMVAARLERDRVLQELSAQVQAWLAPRPAGDAAPRDAARVATEESDAARVLRLFGRQ